MTQLTLERPYRRGPLTFSIDEVDKLLPSDDGTVRIKFKGNHDAIFIADAADVQRVLDQNFGPSILRFAEMNVEQQCDAFNTQMRKLGSKLRRRVHGTRWTYSFDGDVETLHPIA